MKKLISILLILSMVALFAACGNEADKESGKPSTESESQVSDNSENQEATDDTKLPEQEKDDESEKADENKPSAKPTEKPEESKPTAKPTEKPEDKPAESKPTEKPAETPKTIGTKLLADFKANASGKSTEEIANALLSNSAIKFSGVTAPVEEGLLQGFSNTEIKGFKSGTMFAPMIGSIAFVGYIFELENGADTSSFISTLRSNANLRWNVCVEAEEMITGSVGNKVFFVMSPKEMED